MDIYETRAQLKAIDLMEPEYSFLYDMTCRDGGAVEDDKAIYDFRKGQHRMAPVVHPGTGGVVMERGGFETREVGFCTIAPERMIELENVKSRSFGEDILGAKTPEQRAREMQARDIKDMRIAIQLRREHMARQVALTGKLELFEYTNEGRGKSANLLADYGFTNEYIPGTPWSQNGANVEYDMERMMDMVQAGLGYVEWIIMAPDVADAMRNNGGYTQHLDIRNMNVGEFNQKYRGQGVRFLGYNIDGVEMYSYAGTFVDDSGNVQSVIPSGKLIMGHRDMLTAYHGPISQVEENGMNAKIKTYIRKEVPLRIGSVENNSIKNRLTSRPTIVPANVDGWLVATVL